MPKRVTVGNLIESIGRRDRTNTDGFEQTIEAGLRHGQTLVVNMLKDSDKSAYTFDYCLYAG